MCGDKMKCIECDKEAVYLLVSAEEDYESLKALCTAKPGQIVPMHHPEKLRGYCADHWPNLGVTIEVSHDCPSPQNPCMCLCHLSDSECWECRMERHKPKYDLA